MKIVEYKNEQIFQLWHNRELAERSGVQDIRELPDNHPDLLAWIEAEQAARDAKAAEHNTAKDTIDAILAKAPADVTAAEIKLLVLKIAKYLRKRM
jgi:hypothetical protein